MGFAAAAVERAMTYQQVIETKGFDPIGEVKAAAAQRWVSAVNAEGSYGQWAYALVKRVGDIGSVLSPPLPQQS